MTDISSEKVFVDVDVSKFHLDLFFPDTGEVLQIENSESAVGTLCTKLKGYGRFAKHGWRRY